MIKNFKSAGLLACAGLLTLATAVPAVKMEGLSGLTLQVEVYVYNPTNLRTKRVAHASILESMENYKPETDNWFIRPYKDPPEPFTQPEYRAVVKWSLQQDVAGLILDGHSELGDEDVARLRDLHKLAVLSLRKTGITDHAMKTIGQLKNLKVLDISETNVTAKGLAAIKSLNLDQLCYAGSKISDAEFAAFQKSKKSHVAELGEEWSYKWDKERNPEPLQEPLSYFAGDTPEEGIPGHLPRGKYPAPLNIQLHSLDGKTVNLTSQKGRVIFMNIWGIDNGASRSELPALENLYQAIKDENIFFAYVTTQPEARVQEALQREPRKLPIYLADEKELAPYLVNGIPATVVISKKGDKIVFYKGALRWDTAPLIEYLKKVSRE
jgi:hypothetical protein